MMATVISAYDSSGCVGRCDSRCHDAKYETCNCICGGTNHGVGIDRAIENTNEMAEAWIETYQDENPDVTDFRVKPMQRQLKLL